MNRQIVFIGTPEEARRLIGTLPDIISGRAPDPYGVARSMQLRGGVALLSEVQQAFVVKSRGGVGSDGIQWPPLQPQTIANRRTTREERKDLGIGKGLRPSLTKEQDNRWKQVYARVLRQALVDLSPNEAKAKAGQIAWATVKNEGAKTKLQLLGGRQVDMLRDTGLLFRSFSPGVDDRPSGAEGQVFEIPPGRIIVGTTVKPWHHTGDPARGLPARPFWPTDGSLPEKWLRTINRALVTGAVVAITQAFGVA